MFYRVLFICLLHFSNVFGDLCRIDPSGITFLTPVKQQGIDTPDTLLTPPNIYGFNGPCYDCTEEGLYRYYVGGTNCTQRLVFKGNIPTLMHSLTWIHAHGYHDDKSSYSSLLTTAKTRRIRATCGSISQFSETLCNDLGITCRFILFLSLEPWNTYNNGHSCLEVYDNGQWKLWDIDTRHIFKRNGIDLNAIELRDAVKDDDYEFISFSQSPNLAMGDLVYSGYDYGFFAEGEFIYPERLKAFFDRSIQVVLVRVNGYFYFTCEPVDRAYVESYNPTFIYMTDQDFMETFYP